MAKVVKFNSFIDEDMKDYHKKIWKHRVSVGLKYLLAALLVFGALLGIRYYFNNRSYTGYSVASSVQRTDTLTTQYAALKVSYDKSKALKEAQK